MADPPPPSAIPFDYPWRNGDRALSWKPLSRVKVLNLRIIEILSLLGFVYVLPWIVLKGLRTIVILLDPLPGLPTFQIPHSLNLWGCVGVGLPLSPWLLDVVLQVWYGLEPLTLKTLRQHSPEAAKLLRQFFCQDQGVSFPLLSLLPTQAPVIFSYGHLPRTARLVISQGLLDHLEDGEIAALYAGEMGHFLNRDSWLLPSLVLILQLPYGLYWHFAHWGDTFQAYHQASSNLFWRSIWSLGIYGNGLASGISYGLFKLGRWPLLWLSRQRTYYSDRAAANFTGNPNGYSRALLKWSISTRHTLEQQGFIPALLEGFELLMPLGYHTAIPLAHASAQQPFEATLTWDCHSPYRHWLSLNNAHPPTGDRLYLLGLYARHWQLEPELDLPDLTPALRLWPTRRSRSVSGGESPRQSPQTSPTSFQQQISEATRRWWQLMNQGLPYWGIGLGLGIGLFLWFLSAFGNLVGLWQMAWIFGNVTILKGCLPIGIGLGLGLRHNRFFPDLPRQGPDTQGDPGVLLTDSTKLPIDPQPIRWQGQILGRSGMSNAFGQDLWLLTEMGLVKLHHCSGFGPLGELRPGAGLRHWVQKTVTLEGWLRRGLTLWIDVERVRHKSTPSIQGTHPLWLLALALGLILWGIWIFLK